MHLGSKQVCDLVGGGDGPDVLGARIFVLLEPVHDAVWSVDGQLDVEVDDRDGGAQSGMHRGHDLKGYCVTDEKTNRVLNVREETARGDGAAPASPICRGGCATLQLQNGSNE